MAVVRAFRGVRPAEDKASSVAALPYDVYNREEARDAVAGHPLSFLNIDRPETQFPADADMYAPKVYAKARELFDAMQADGTFIQDDTRCFYIYALTLDGRTQTGLVGCASIDDYLDGTIRRHENTRESKELDRICHVDALDAQTGPIFLTYRSQTELTQLIAEETKAAPLYDFTCEDTVRHQVWKIERPDVIEKISQLFSQVPTLYIADGHHRAASAVKVGLKRREACGSCTGDEEFQYFLSVLFPAEELEICAYNRVVTSLNGHTAQTLLDSIRHSFQVEELEDGLHWTPEQKGEIGLYCGGKWYKLTAEPFLYSEDPVHGLDVSVLQDVILEPLLGIQDPTTDPRIRFVGGIRGMEELERLVDEQPEAAAFAMYPTSMKELLTVADADRLMPPKSTWFEPKLRSGLLIHKLDSK